ncbi:MAG: peroxiredoxin family protein [Candidatus Binatia bacterium]
MKRYKILAILVISALLVLFVLSSSGDGFLHRRKAPVSDEKDSFTKLRIGKFEEPVVAPDFTLKGLDGSQVTLRDLRGRVVFLNFWATWCPPCRLEMPSMERLYRRLKEKGLLMLAVDMQESEKLVAEFMRDFNLSFPALLDRDGSVTFLYGVRGIPSTYIIDRAGRVVGRAVGPRDWASQESMQLFQSLLKKAASLGP